ncbi:MAG TPA: hypothetical protein VGU20_20705 [Stellaceae bacterium]|nr:hypothetical protein [Stellaceae bacterium]
MPLNIDSNNHGFVPQVRAFRKAAHEVPLTKGLSRTVEGRDDFVRDGIGVLSANSAAETGTTRTSPNPDFLKLDNETSPRGGIVPGMEPSFFQPAFIVARDLSAIAAAADEDQMAARLRYGRVLLVDPRRGLPPMLTGFPSAQELAQRHECRVRRPRGYFRHRFTFFMSFSTSRRLTRSARSIAPVTAPSSTSVNVGSFALLAVVPSVSSLLAASAISEHTAAASWSLRSVKSIDHRRATSGAF